MMTHAWTSCGESIIMSHQQKLFPQKSEQEEGEEEEEEEHETCTNLKRPPPYGRGLNRCWWTIRTDTIIYLCKDICMVDNSCNPVWFYWLPSTFFIIKCMLLCLYFIFCHYMPLIFHQHTSNSAIKTNTLAGCKREAPLVDTSSILVKLYLAPSCDLVLSCIVFPGLTGTGDEYSVQAPPSILYSTGRPGNSDLALRYISPSTLKIQIFLLDNSSHRCAHAHLSITILSIKYV